MPGNSCPSDCKVYVGNLRNNGNKTELERTFGYYGPLQSMWVARNPPGFAVIESEDPRDAADAVRELAGRTQCGCLVRVELSNGEKRSWNHGRLPLEVVLEMITAGGVFHLGTDPQEGEAFLKARAGHILDIEDKGLCLMREITSHLHPSVCLVADLGQMQGNRRPVCKSGVEEITSFDGSMYRKLKFCLRRHKLGAFLKCFSCSNLFCLLEQ